MAMNPRWCESSPCGGLTFKCSPVIWAGFAPGSPLYMHFPTERVLLERLFIFLSNSVASADPSSLKHLVWPQILKIRQAHVILRWNKCHLFLNRHVSWRRGTGEVSWSWWPLGEYWQTGKGEGDWRAAPESRRRSKAAQGVRKLGMGSTVELTLRHEGWVYWNLGEAYSLVGGGVAWRSTGNDWVEWSRGLPWKSKE